MYLQVNIDDGFLNLMTNDGIAKDDVKVPEGDLGKEIQGGFDDGKDLLVTIIAAMGEEQVCFFYLCSSPSFVVTLYRLSPSRRHRKALPNPVWLRNPQSYNLAILEDIDSRYLVIGWCYCILFPASQSCVYPTAFALLVLFCCIRYQTKRQ